MIASYFISELVIWPLSSHTDFSINILVSSHDSAQCTHFRTRQGSCCVYFIITHNNASICVLGWCSGVQSLWMPGSNPNETPWVDAPTPSLAVFQRQFLDCMPPPCRLLINSRLLATVGVGSFSNWPRPHCRHDHGLAEPELVTPLMWSYRTGLTHPIQKGI